MVKTCEVCGSEFEAKRSRAMYCSGRCSKRAQRQPDNSGTTKTRAERPVPVSAGLITATATKLAKAGQLETPEGQAAMILAMRVELGTAETGAAIASLVRQLHATLAEALKDAPEEMTALDELRLRRERKLSAG